MAETAREFFSTLALRVDRERAAGVDGSYRFDVEGAGTWIVRVRDGDVSVTEGAGDADCTVVTSEPTFLRIAGGEQNPAVAFMAGELKVYGDLGAALKLQTLF